MSKDPIRVRVQVEELEGRWQPAASFSSNFSAFCGDAAESHQGKFDHGFHRGWSWDWDGWFARGRGHDRHDHCRSHRHDGDSKWEHRFDCLKKWHGKSCELHHHCDKPTPEPEPERKPSLGSLSGYVFIDLDGNGVLDGDDRPIANTTIMLSWEDPNLGGQETMVVTAADGSYLFEDLAGGLDYAIMELQPSPYEDGDDYIGTLGGEQLDDMFIVRVEEGQKGENYNFTERFGE